MRKLIGAILGVMLALAATGAWGAPTQDPMVGNPKAAVRVIIYQDLECPGCAALHQELMKSLLPEYGARVSFEFRDFPLTNIHPWSFNAAVYARYLDARDPKLGLAWRDYCFNHQDEITAGNLLDTAARFCASAGITRDELAESLSRQDLFAAIARDVSLGRAAHLDQTPFVLVNGQPLPPSKAISQLITYLRAALAAALVPGRRD